MSELFKKLQKLQTGGVIDSSEPKKWIINYMNSPVYKERLAKQNVYNIPKSNIITNTNVIPVNDGSGSAAWNIEDTGKTLYTQATTLNTNGYKNISLKAGVPNMAIDSKELNKVGANTQSVLAHELSHISRPLTNNEQLQIGSMDKHSGGLINNYKVNYNQYKDYNDSVRQNTASEDTHELLPAEHKADLDALRFMMQKRGIYDTSKGNMNLQDLRNALQDKEISDDLSTKRLLNQFSPEDLVKMNNTIAQNRTSTINYSQQGGSLSLKIDNSLSDNKKAINTVLPNIQSQADWTKSYINSPMYKDRLTRQASTERALIREDNPNPYSITGAHYGMETQFSGQRTIWNPSTAASNVISHQNTQLSSLLNGKIKVGNFQLSGGMGGAAEYDPSNDMINMKENVAASTAGKLIPAHEISHGINKGLAPYSQAFRERFIDGKVLQPITGTQGDPYVQTPTEVKARLDAMRYQMKQGGYYDAGTQKFDSNTLQKLKTDPNIVNDVNYQTLSKELPEGRKDESLMWLFNNIAQNKSQQSIIHAQQGAKLTMKKDNTNIVRMPLIPDHVDDNEIIRAITAKHPAWTSDAFKKQLMKYGNPKLEYSSLLGFTPIAGKYNPYTNGIMISDKYKGNLPMTEDLVLDELAHAKQRQENPFETFIKAPIQNIARPFINMYNTPGTFEYNAHSVLEPQIKKEYNDDINKNYIPSRDEYDDDDPDSPFNKPKKLSKLELLKKNNKPLPTQQRLGYEEWKNKLPTNLQYEGNYDLKGYYNKYGNEGPAANGHLTDEFKLPNHPTFSNESIYFNDQTKNKAGYWTPNDVYIPFNENRPSFDEGKNKYINFTPYQKALGIK